MDPQFIVPIVAAALGGGGLSVLLGHILRRKSDAAAIDKTRAETDYLHVQTKRLEGEMKTVQAQAAAVQERVNTIVKYSLSFYLSGYLSRLYRRDEKFRYDPNGRLPEQLRLLRDLGYLEVFRTSDLKKDDKLVDKLGLTPLGRLSVEFREGAAAGHPHSE